MHSTRRWLVLLALFSFILYIMTYLTHNFLNDNTDAEPNILASNTKVRATFSNSNNDEFSPIATISFGPAPVKAKGEAFSKALIVPRTKDDDASWIVEHFGGDQNVKEFLYSVDDFSTTLHVPKNKGHEVMAYLSYIIDNYHNLADVNIFMHAHRYAWHNDEILGYDSVQILSWLSAERVQREGYINLRCHWEPGCPAWIHPGTIEEDINKQEQTLFARSWLEIFPTDPIPTVLAQPCCGQFAVSRERIRTLPLTKYVLFRHWLLQTPLSDYISGRVWEYIWQFVFTGEHVVCPKEHVCYCDGFGVCFGGEDEYDEYDGKRKGKEALDKDLKRWKELNEERRALLEEGHTEADEALVSDAGMDLELEKRIRELQVWCDERKQKAKKYGDVARNRALEAGRRWKEGDGF